MTSWKLAHFWPTVSRMLKTVFFSSPVKRLVARMPTPSQSSRIDVHLFAEALVSIAHLIYRHELAVPRAQHVYNAVRGLLIKQNYIFLESDEANIAGDVEQIIRVDFLIRDRRPIACKTVERRGRMRDYMEQWGYRWVDAKNHNKKLSRAMFFDPDNQQWDEESLRIGQNVCEVFLPYFDTSGIIKALERESN